MNRNRKHWAAPPNWSWDRSWRVGVGVGTGVGVGVGDEQKQKILGYSTCWELEWGLE